MSFSFASGFDLVSFGSEAFHARVNEGLENQNLNITPSKNEAAGMLQIGNECFGTVFLDSEKSPPVFFVHEKEDREYNFPWEFRHNTPLYVFEYTGNSDVPIVAFEQFAAFMKRFEAFLIEYLKGMGSEATGDVLPESFYGILQYEFFREILANTTHMEFAILEAKSHLKNRVLMVMAKVYGKDGQNIHFQDLIQVPRV